MREMKDETAVSIAAICSLAGLGIAALLKGIDSGLLTSIAAIIGGIAGYRIGKVKGGSER